MAQTHYGQLDLTALGKVVRQQPNLVKKVNFKDGEHQLINIRIFDKDTPDEHGNTGFIKIGVKKDEEQQGLRYFIANLKPAEQNGQQQPSNNQQPRQQEEMPNGDDLPF